MSLLIMLSLILTFTLLGQVTAEESLDVYIEGEKQSFKAEPFIYENRTLIPARDVSEALGATVLWDAEKKAVTIFKDDVTLFFTIGSSLALVNNEFYELDTKPLIVHSNSFVPLRFISEAFGADVQWDGTNNNVFISLEATTNAYFNSDFLEQVAQGKLKGCDYALNAGIAASTILSDKGEPEIEGSMGGSHFLTYDHCQYHVSFSDYYNKNYDEANLLSIKHLAKSIDATPADVKNELGLPFSEGKSELSDKWYLTYLAGDYKVILSAENETSAITEIHLKENRSTTLDLEVERLVTTQGNDEIVFYVRNPLDKEQVLEFNTSQEYDYRLLKDGEIVEQFSASRSFIQIQQSITLEPNEVITYSANFPSLEAGEYVIEFWLTSFSHPDAQTNMTFESKQ